MKKKAAKLKGKRPGYNFGALMKGAGEFAADNPEAIQAGASMLGAAGDLAQNQNPEKPSAFGNIGGTAGKFAAAGAAAGPWGAAIGGVVGAGVGVFKQKGQMDDYNAQVDANKKADEKLAQDYSDKVLFSYDNRGFGGPASTFAKGGLMESAPTEIADGGYLKPISDTATEVIGDNPSETDGVTLLERDVDVDNAESIQTSPKQGGEMVFTDAYNEDGDKPTKKRPSYATIHKGLQKSKVEGEQFSRFNAFIDKKSEVKFQEQESHKDENGVVMKGRKTIHSTTHRGRKRMNMGGLDPNSLPALEDTAAMLNDKDAAMAEYMQGSGSQYYKPELMGGKQGTISYPYSADGTNDGNVLKIGGSGEVGTGNNVFMNELGDEAFGYIANPPSEMNSRGLGKSSVEPITGAIKKARPNANTGKDRYYDQLHERANRVKIDMGNLDLPDEGFPAEGGPTSKVPGNSPEQVPNEGNDWGKALGRFSEYIPDLIPTRLPGPKMGKFVDPVHLDRADNRKELYDIGSTVGSTIRNTKTAQASAGNSLAASLTAKGLGAKSESHDKTNKQNLRIENEEELANVRGNMFNAGVVDKFNDQILGKGLKETEINTMKMQNLSTRMGADRRFDDTVDKDLRIADLYKETYKNSGVGQRAMDAHGNLIKGKSKKTSRRKSNTSLVG